MSERDESEAPSPLPAEPPALEQKPTIPAAPSGARSPSWLWPVVALALFVAAIWPLPLHVLSYRQQLVSSPDGGSELYSTLLMHQRVQLALVDVYAWTQQKQLSWLDTFSTLWRSASELAYSSRSWNVLDILLLDWPLTSTLGMWSGWNAMFLLILTLNAAAGYVLGARLGGHPAAGMVAGAALALNPLVLVYMSEGRPIQTLLFLFPVVILAVDHITRTDDNKKALLVGALALAVLAQFYWFYGLFCGFVIGLMLLLPPRLIRLERLGWLVVMGAISILVSVPLFLEMGRAMRSEQKALTLPNAQLSRTVFPPPESPELTQDQRITLQDSAALRAPLIPRFASEFGRWQNVAYVPPAVLGLAAIGLLAGGRALPWLALTLLGWVLSWGPWLLTLSRQPWTWQGRPIANPVYMLLYEHASIFRQLTHPYRFFALVWIGLGVLGALGAGLLMRGALPWQRGRGRAVTMAACALLMVGMMKNLNAAGLLPLKLAWFPEPPGLASLFQSQRGAVLHLPLEKPPGEMPPMSGDYERRLRFLQLYHRQPMMFLWSHPRVRTIDPEDELPLFPGYYLMQDIYSRELPRLLGRPGQGEPFDAPLHEALRLDEVCWVLLDEAGMFQVHGAGEGGRAYDALKGELTTWLGDARTEVVFDNRRFLTWNAPGSPPPERLRLAIWSTLFCKAP